MRANRGDFGNPGTDSPFRDRSPDENLARFRDMRDGKHADGAAVLRAKIDMASPNINLRDPALYRIRRATHHNTGDTWCIYPMYTYAHPIEDALEGITHSICTLEFEDQRPFYDWLLDTLWRRRPAGAAAPAPVRVRAAQPHLRHHQQAQAASSWSTSSIVDGWDDPRMPTIVGLRRRGYTPESLRCSPSASASPRPTAGSTTRTLDSALRDDLDAKAPRAMAVLDPLKLVLDELGRGVRRRGTRSRPARAPVHPHQPERGRREFSFGRRAVDRARRLRGSAAQGLLPPASRATRCA